MTLELSMSSLRSIENAFQDYMQFNPNFPKITLTNSQLRSIQAILQGKDLLCVLPTGGGKTFCMVLPTVLDSLIHCRRATTLIISPLDSLMDDMESRINSWGYVAKAIRGDVLTIELIRAVYEEMSNSSTLENVPAFFITSPEALLNCEDKEEMFRMMDPFSICIDEGHCIQMWGSQLNGEPPFRPAYGQLSRIRCHTSAPMAIFTATVTKDMIHDIIKKTCLRTKTLVKIIEIPNRPNLYLDMRQSKRNESHLQFLLSELLLHGDKTPKTIIFINSAKDTVPVFYYFYTNLGPEHRKGKANRLVGVYSSSMGQLHRKETSELFSNKDSSLRVLIATIAFGMGVDIPFVRRVILWGIPSDPVSCWQEIGRCGRDGQPGEILIYPFSPRGNIKSKFTISTTSCVRNDILANFFGTKSAQTITPAPCQNNCESCMCIACSCCSYCRSLCSCKLMETE